MQAKTKVILNTCILYARMLITVGITLYTIRLALNALGEIDYGIYNLIVGVIAMLSFLNAAMTTSTQRFLSFYQGRKDTQAQKDIFYNSFLLHIFLGLIIVLGLETAGLFLFSGFLNIPSDRIFTAKVIYHFMSATVFFTVISVPFSASLNAHEDMLWVAIVNIIEALLKLGVALALYIFTGDKLIFYGISMAVISIISLLFYGTYCMRKYEECSLLRGKLNPNLMKRLASFASWNLFGAICGIGKTQGLAILFNIFLGAVINAAYAIANQVSAQMNFFSVTMLKALNPQIMKSEGMGDRQRVLRLSMLASKLSFFLLAFIALPCISEMPAILKFWLKEVPAHTISFCSLILIAVMIDQLTIGLSSAVQAIGKLRIYMLIAGAIKLLILPLGYILLKSGSNVNSVFLGYAFCEFIAGIARLFLLKYQSGLSIKIYFQNVFLKIAFPVLITISYLFFIVRILDFEYRFVFTLFSGSIIFILFAYLLGMSNNEKKTINDMIIKIPIKMGIKK